MDQTFLPIHPQILRIDTNLPFDVFIHTKAGAYDCLFKTGKQYTALLHVKIFKYSLPALYINDIDRDKYFGYLEENIDIIFKDLFISIKSKARIAHEYISNLAMILLDTPEKENVLRYMRAVSLISDFIYKHDEAVRYLITMTSSSFQEYNHLINVGIYGLGLLKESVGDIPDDTLHDVAAGFFLHDIGLSGIPKHIKLKNGKLSNDEWAIIKKHPEKGYQMLLALDIDNADIKTIILQHHERHSGNGYPNNLSGNQIHLYSKICTIADAFDALTSHRPYRYAQSSFNALKTMQNEMKKEFDPKLFAKFVLLFSKQKQHENQMNA